MSIGIIAATFALVLPAELPDKTFISAIILSSRHRPLPVWIGAASALLLQAGIAVLAGRLIALFPHRVVAAIVAALFFGGAAYLFFISPDDEEVKGEEIAAREERVAVGAAPAPAIALSDLRVALTTFGVVAAAEFGDLTQVLIANLSARTRQPLSVFVGAAVAFVFISGIGVLAGRALLRVVPLALVRKLSAVALFGLGTWSLVTAVS